jgi:hypothetical protein
MAAPMTTKNHDWEITCTGFAKESRKDSFIAKGYFRVHRDKSSDTGDYRMSVAAHKLAALGKSNPAFVPATSSPMARAQRSSSISGTRLSLRSTTRALPIREKFWSVAGRLKAAAARLI